MRFTAEGSFAMHIFTSARVIQVPFEIWDIGPTQIGPTSKASGFGLRTAAYPQPGRDLALELATYAAEDFRMARMLGVDANRCGEAYHQRAEYWGEVSWV